MNSLFSHTKRTENPYRWNESYFLLGCCFRFFNWGSNYCLVVKQFNREENKIYKNKLTQITDTQKSNRMEVGRQSKKQQQYSILQALCFQKRSIQKIVDPDFSSFLNFVLFSQQANGGNVLQRIGIRITIILQEREREQWLPKFGRIQGRRPSL